MTSYDQKIAAAYLQARKKNPGAQQDLLITMVADEMNETRERVMETLREATKGK